MSHYPSTAELAEFRRRIPYRPDYGAVHPFSTTGQEQHPVVGTAWDVERTHGIGKSGDDLIRCRGSHVGVMRCAVEVGDRYARTRREAAAMRSRSYLAECHYCDHPTSSHTGHNDGGEPDACTVPSCGCQWWDENTYGNPFAPRYCECCGNLPSDCDCYGIRV